MLRKSILFASAVVAVHGLGQGLALAGTDAAAGPAGPALSASSFNEPPAGPPLSDFEKQPAETPASGDEIADENTSDKSSDKTSRAPASTGSRAIARADDNAGSDDDEYNFSWLDPDKKVYVLQNRKYRKKGRLAIFASGGLNLNNPYRTEYEFVPRAAYYFSEMFGLEVFYSTLTNSDNSTLTALKQASPAALPYIRENRSYYGAALSWTPWYSKLNFFNKILYFDWQFNAGAGQANTFVNTTTVANAAPNYVEQDLFTLFYGTDMMFYVTKNFLVRFDLIGMMYDATGADNVTKSWVQNYEFTAGIGWAF